MFECGSETLTLERLREVVESRLHLLPPFRRRLVDVPLGLDRPSRADDPDFDIDVHLRVSRFPPGSETQGDPALKALRLQGRALAALPAARGTPTASPPRPSAIRSTTCGGG